MIYMLFPQKHVEVIRMSDGLGHDILLITTTLIFISFVLGATRDDEVIGEDNELEVPQIFL